MPTLIGASRQRFRKKVKRISALAMPAVAKAMSEDAEHVSEVQRRLVPKDTGALAAATDWTFGAIPDHVKTASLEHDPAHAVAAAQSTGSIRAILFSGDADAYWGPWVEYGTQARAPGSYRDANGKKGNAGARGHAATKAQPYFWSAWRAFRKSIRARQSRAASKAIKQAASGQ